VKQLASKDSNGEVSIAQLVESFKADPSFAELSSKDSVLRKSLESRYLVKAPQAEGADESSQKVSVQALLLVGILFCDGDDKLRAAAFTDALHAGPKDDIARDDADLAAALVLLVQLATSWTAHFAQVSSGKNVSQTDEDEFEAKMKPVYDALVAKFLVDVYGADGKTLTRADFTGKLAGAASGYLKPSKVKEIVAEHKHALKLDALTLTGADGAKNRNFFEKIGDGVVGAAKAVGDAGANVANKTAGAFKKEEEKKEGDAPKEGGDAAKDGAAAAGEAHHEEGKTEEAKTDAPKTDAPKTEAPKTEEAKTEAPKTEAPKTEAPKAEAPKEEAPKEAKKEETA
jgi:hypothetical protein